jgi:hypothetical protein
LPTFASAIEVDLVVDEADAAILRVAFGGVGLLKSLSRQLAVIE